MAENALKFSENKQCQIMPSSSVKKQLFGVSNCFETKRMLKELFKDEACRFRSSWNFDIRLLDSSGKIVDNEGLEIRNCATPLAHRYEWQVCKENSIPGFYTRPPHFHHSEARSSQIIHEQEKQLAMSLFVPLDRASPVPLSLRNENTISLQIENMKKPINTNKSNLASNSLPKSYFKKEEMVANISSCHQAMPSQSASSPNCSINKFFQKNLNQVESNSRQIEKNKSNKTCLSVQLFNGIFSNEDQTARTISSMFKQTSPRKRKSRRIVSTQQKITDMMPVCKRRTLSVKSALSASHGNQSSSDSN